MVIKPFNHAISELTFLHIVMRNSLINALLKGSYTYSYRIPLIYHFTKPE